MMGESGMDAKPEFACVDETHYIHLGINEKTGRPCNSSVGPSSFAGFYEDEAGGAWYCLGCCRFFDEMPQMDAEGLAALCHMRPAED